VSEYTGMHYERAVRLSWEVNEWLGQGGKDAASVYGYTGTQ
jgi:hypothetical protein